MNIIEQYQRKKKEQEYLYHVILKWAAQQAGIYLTRSWTWRMDLSGLKVHFKYENDRGGYYRTDKKVVDLRPLIEGRSSKLIKINDSSHRIYEPTISFEDVMTLSGKTFKTPEAASVTYQGPWGKGKSRLEGKLTPGQECEIIEDMTFRVGLVDP